MRAVVILLLVLTPGLAPAQGVPDDVKKHLERAEKLAGELRMDDALAEFDEALKLDPKCVAGWVGRAKAQRYGNTDGALKDLDKAIECDPKCVDALLERAQLLSWRKHDVAGARRDLEAAVAAQPGRADAWYELSKARMKAGEQDIARKALEEAIRLDPGNTHYRGELVGAYMMAGDFDGGLKALDDALAASPQAADLLRIRATLRMEMRKWGPAAEDFDAEIHVKKDNHGVLGSELSRWICRARAGHEAEATKEIMPVLTSKALGMESDSDALLYLTGRVSEDDYLNAQEGYDAESDAMWRAAAWRVIGMRRLLNGNKDAARDALTRAKPGQRRGPAGIPSSLDADLHDLGDGDGKLDQAATAREENHKASVEHLWKSKDAEKAKKQEEQAAEIKKALECNPRSPKALLWRAHLFPWDDLAEKEKAYSDVLAVVPGMGTARDARAEVRLMAGNFQGVLDDADEMIRCPGPTGLVDRPYEFHAIALAALGKWEEAVKAQERVIELSKSYSTPEIRQQNELQLWYLRSRLGNTKEAAERLRTAVKGEEDESLFVIFLIRFALGDLSEKDCRAACDRLSGSKPDLHRVLIAQLDFYVGARLLLSGDAAGADAAFQRSQPGFWRVTSFECQVGKVEAERIRKK